MTASLFATNLVLWSVQIAIVAGTAVVFPRLLALKMPKDRLLFWQLVLLICLVLPAMSPWKRDVIAGKVSASTTIISASANPSGPHHFPFSLNAVLLAIAAAGILVRMGFLLSGFLRLHRLHLEAEPLSPSSSWGVEADLRISPEVISPVTFGFRKPVALLPQGFGDLSVAMQDAIICHEIVHVRRHDWLFMLGEELIRALLWFHPAIWWLLREIQLVREQAVDREVIEMTKSRDQYIDALLLFAGAPRSDLAPAPLFLRRNHLKDRVASILKEAHMSTSKSLSAFAASITLLAASCWFITAALPLHAAPQLAPDAGGVAVDAGSAELLHRDPVPYPPDAIAKGIQGSVVADLKLDGTGNVVDATIISGPDELRKPVLQSVLNWHFNPGGATTREVTIKFAVPAPAGQNVNVSAPRSSPLMIPGTVVNNIRISGISDPARDQLMAQLPISVGETLTTDAFARLLGVVQAFDNHLDVRAVRASETETTVVISRNDFPAKIAASSADSQAVLVDPEAQSANLLTQVTPVYPPLAKAARVQGAVRFEATIGKDGHVQNLKLISGPPLLVQSAMQAVQQWVYKATLVNGNPVEVTTTIKVNYTLAE